MPWGSTKLVLGFVFSHLEKTFPRTLVFWYAFLTSFWGSKTMVLSKRRIVAVPRVGVVIDDFCLQLSLLYFLLPWFVPLI